MINIKRIAEVLGGEKILRKDIRSTKELAELIETGLPHAALEIVAKRLYPRPNDTKAFIHRIASIHEHEQRSQLTPEESERLLELARVIATAEYVWDDPEEARWFLKAPHPLLNNRSPCEIAVIESGAHVEDILWKIHYGHPS